MKRLSNLFDKICTIENIEEADRKARKNKKLLKKLKLYERTQKNNV